MVRIGYEFFMNRQGKEAFQGDENGGEKEPEQIRKDNRKNGSVGQIHSG